MAIIKRDHLGRFAKGCVPSNKAGLTKKCPTCGKIFNVKPSSYERRKYCSKKCVKRPYNGYLKKINTTGRMVKCQECGKEYWNYLSYIKKGRKKFCSRECSSKHLSRIFKGSNGSNWRGGITPLDNQERKLFRQQIVKDVLERDDFTCQKCGKKGGNLQIHHIKEWSKHPELRFNKENCMTLCMKCHYFTTFGKIMPNHIKSFGRNYRKQILCQ